MKKIFAWIGAGLLLVIGAFGLHLVEKYFVKDWEFWLGQVLLAPLLWPAIEWYNLKINEP